MPHGSGADRKGKTMKTRDHSTVSSKIKEADGALDTLRDSLAEAGITLPSLRVDPSTWSSSTGSAMIDLGPCNSETADRLAALLRTARTTGRPDGGDGGTGSAVSPGTTSRRSGA